MNAARARARASSECVFCRDFGSQRSAEAGARRLHFADQEPDFTNVHHGAVPRRGF
jgi:hypothetical protein